jgi:hypothetical protein
MFLICSFVFGLKFGFVLLLNVKYDCKQKSSAWRGILICRWIKIIKEKDVVPPMQNGEWGVDVGGVLYYTN